MAAGVRVTLWTFDDLMNGARAGKTTWIKQFCEDNITATPVTAGVAVLTLASTVLAATKGGERQCRLNPGCGVGSAADIHDLGLACMHATSSRWRLIAKHIVQAGLALCRPAAFV